MKNTKKFPISIRLKIFALYVLVLSTTLFFFGFLIYLSFRETLERKADELLSAKVQAVESAVYAYQKAHSEVQPEQPSSNWFHDIFGGEEKKSTAEEPYSMIMRFLAGNGKSLGPSDTEIFIDIYGRDGRRVNSSNPNRDLVQMSQPVLHQALQGKKIFRDLYISSGSEPEKQIRMRAMIAPIKVDGKVDHIVQARLSLQFVTERLDILSLQLFLRALIVVVIASWGSLILVRITLRPVDRMTQRIREIRQDNLNQRIPLPETRDEIARLAETFNSMIEGLEKSFQAQKQIVADISHDLKIPLTVIQGQMEVTLKRDRSPEEYKEILYSTLEEIEKLKVVIDDLLTLARLDDPANSLEMASVDLSSLIENITQDIYLLGLSKNLQVEFSSSEQVYIRGNKRGLDRTFRNLLENAVKYNVDEGSVSISVKKEDGEAVVRVQDSGIGMPQEELGKIFDRFYRVDRARSSSEGYGLGLCIAKSIVEAHEGRIDVSSRLGKGTLFEVRIPV